MQPGNREGHIVKKRCSKRAMWLVKVGRGDATQRRKGEGMNPRHLYNVVKEWLWKSALLGPLLNSQGIILGSVTEAY